MEQQTTNASKVKTSYEVSSGFLVHKVVLRLIVLHQKAGL